MSAQPFQPLLSALDRAGIPHMLPGSFAAAFHGRPRATQGVDLVIEPDERSLREFIAMLPRSTTSTRTPQSRHSTMSRNATSSTLPPDGNAISYP